MENLTKKSTKNQLVFEQIKSYSKSIWKMGKNVPMMSTYLQDGTIKRAYLAQRYKFNSNYSQFWLSKLELAEINNVAAYRIILQILSELEYNNPLWRRNDKDGNGRFNSQTSAALKVLERCGIVIPFRGTQVYYVVPTKLSCGNPFDVAFAWLEFVKTYNIGPEMIKDIKIRSLKKPKEDTIVVNLVEYMS